MKEQATYRIKKQEKEKKRIALVKKYTICKMVSFVFMGASLLSSLTFMFVLIDKQNHIRDEISQLAESVGYVDGTDMDWYMRYSKDVSKDNYVRYADLQNELQDTKRLQMINLGGGVIAATTSFSLGLESEKKEKYYSNKDVEILL